MKKIGIAVMLSVAVLLLSSCALWQSWRIQASISPLTGLSPEDPEPLFRIENIYDSAGNLIRKPLVSIRTDGTYVFRGYETWEYDAENRLIQHSTFSSGILTSYTRYEYDEQNRVAKESTYDAAGGLTDCWVNTYRENGRELHQQRYNANGEPTNQCVETYDAAGRQLSYWYYAADGKVVSHHEIEYDADGRDIKRTHYAENNKLTGFSTYQYDEKGNQIRSEAVNASGEVSVSEYSYTYDENGIVRKKITKQDGEVTSQIQYEYDSDGRLLFEKKGWQKVSYYYPDDETVIRTMRDTAGKLEWRFICNKAGQEIVREKY